MIGRYVLIAMVALGMFVQRAALAAGDVPATSPAQDELPAASLFSVQIKDKPLADALSEFTKATGIKVDRVKIEAARHQGQNITLEMKDRPLWDVVGELCLLGGLRVDGSENKAIVLADDLIGWNKLPAQVNGSFRFDIQGIDAEKVVIFGNVPLKTQRYTLGGEIFADPRIPVAGCDGVKIDTLIDEAGRAIPISTKFRLTPQFRRQHANFQVQFEPDAQSHRISRIAGTARIAIEQATQKLEMSKIMEANDRVAVVGQFEIHVTTTPVDNGCEVHIHIKSSDARGVERLRMQGMMDGPTILDEKGQAYRWSGGGSEPGGTLRSTFVKTLFGNGNADLGLPSKLVWMIPTEVRVVTVPFEFKELALP